ncbi:MAG: PEP/pyruvate-binding domain-containing protein [Candidatus Cloacimonadales bacterium]
MKNSEIIKGFHMMKFGEESFLDLMKYKVNEILMISSIYDAYMLQHEGSIDENISQQFKRLDLTVPPRITLVADEAAALEHAKSGKFDLVLNMMRVGKKTSFDLLKRIKHEVPELPVLLLLNKLSYSNYVNFYSGSKDFYDEIFIWNADPQLFVAMIKLIEDMKNVEHDSKVGNVAVTLLVESSQDYFSRFLTLFYTQAIKIMSELIRAERNDMNRMIRMRMRPRIIVAHSYQQALQLYHKYQTQINSVITNVNYFQEGKNDFQGGFKLAKELRQLDPSLAILMQSADQRNRTLAREVGAKFLHKSSPKFLHDFQHFVYENLGFGDFIFENSEGAEIGRVHSISQLEQAILQVPAESILYHSQHRHFSKWLQAHGAPLAAQKVQLPHVEDFSDPAELRQFIYRSIREFRMRKDRGKIVEFEANSFFEDELIIRLAGGSLGGKGRGLAFLNSISVAFDLRDQFANAKIIIPKTAIIGTEEYDLFIEQNNIFDQLEQTPQKQLEELFLDSKISQQLRQKLTIFLKNYQKPLAVRSSGLLEDSQSQPFAGIYQTYIIPNSSTDLQKRLAQLEEAIKLVFSSPFQTQAQDYINSIGNKVEEEKMAVIIQELAGSKQNGDYYYPHISGVAQSYNFYPSVGRKAEDGIATIAVGFGKAVVDGERAYRYCPRYPKHDLLDAKSQIENCQWTLYGLDLNAQNYQIKVDDGLKKIDITPRLLEGNLKQLSTVWDYQNLRFLDGSFAEGDRVITFRNITKYQQFALNDILIRVLEIGEIGMGVPVEIEFAVDLSSDNKYRQPVFSLLQIRPMTVNDREIIIDQEQLDEEKLILKSNFSMGNMMLDEITDLIYLDPGKFANTETIEMVEEISALNKELKAAQRKYILIGPGRWGTSDRFLGVPVAWSQIDFAKIIVETDLENFIVDSSQGSHFFHNLVAAQVGYLKVPFATDGNFVDWKKISKIKPLKSLKYFRHLQLSKPLTVKIDGKSGIGIIQL